MTIQQLEQLDQGQRRLGLAVLVAREGVDSAAEDFGGLALAQIELLAYADDECGINDGRVHLLVEGLHFAHGALRFGDWGQVLPVAIEKQHSLRAKPDSESRQASGKT